MDLAGRDVLFRYPIPGQLIMLRRRVLRIQEQSLATEDSHEKQRLESQLIIDTLDLVESLIVDPDDVEYVEQAMLHGRVTHEQVMDVLRTKREEQKPVKKAAARKTVASRGRTKR